MARRLAVPLFARPQPHRRPLPPLRFRRWSREPSRPCISLTCVPPEHWSNGRYVASRAKAAGDCMSGPGVNRASGWAMQVPGACRGGRHGGGRSPRCRRQDQCVEGIPVGRVRIGDEDGVCRPIRRLAQGPAVQRQQTGGYVFQHSRTVAQQAIAGMVAEKNRHVRASPWRCYAPLCSSVLRRWPAVMAFRNRIARPGPQVHRSTTMPLRLAPPRAGARKGIGKAWNRVCALPGRFSP